MPSIPISSPLSYVGVFLLLLGLFLLLAGLRVIRIEKISVTPGIATVLFGVFLMAFGVAFLLPDILESANGGGDTEGNPAATDQPEIVNLSTPDSTEMIPLVVANDGASMALIPAGPFMMGGEARDSAAECEALRVGGGCELANFADEEPRHQVTLDNFYIDLYEITNELYSIFLNSQGNHLEGGAYWYDSEGFGHIHQIAGVWQPDDGYHDHPVVEVSWYGAKAYCEFRGDRLPTEAEWEKAARGTDGRPYPWGDSFEQGQVNFCDVNCDQDWSNSAFDDGYAATAPVATYPSGTSPYGVYDMAGNVFEWVGDWYAANYYSISPSENPDGPSSGGARSVRGGSWASVGGDLSRTANRGRQEPTHTGDTHGFRCAR